MTEYIRDILGKFSSIGTLQPNWEDVAIDGDEVGTVGEHKMYIYDELDNTDEARLNIPFKDDEWVTIDIDRRGMFVGVDNEYNSEVPDSEHYTDIDEGWLRVSLLTKLGDFIVFKDLF
jgi:hypothetical protein